MVLPQRALWPGVCSSELKRYMTGSATQYVMWTSGHITRRGLSAHLSGGGCCRRGAHAPAGRFSRSTAGCGLLLHPLDVLHEGGRQLLPL